MQRRMSLYRRNKHLFSPKNESRQNGRTGGEWGGGDGIKVPPDISIRATVTGQVLYFRIINLSCFLLQPIGMYERNGMCTLYVLGVREDGSTLCNSI